MGRKPIEHSEDNWRFSTTPGEEGVFYTTRQIREEQERRDAKLNPPDRTVIIGADVHVTDVPVPERKKRDHNLEVEVSPINSVKELPPIGSPIFDPENVEFEFCREPTRDELKSVRGRKRMSPSGMRVGGSGYSVSALGGERMMDAFIDGALADEATYDLYVPSGKVEFQYQDGRTGYYTGKLVSSTPGKHVYKMLGPSVDITEAPFFDRLSSPSSSPFASAKMIRGMQESYIRMADHRNGEELVRFVARSLTMYHSMKAVHDKDVNRNSYSSTYNVHARRPIDGRQKGIRYNMILGNKVKVPLIAIMDFMRKRIEGTRDLPTRKQAAFDLKRRVPHDKAELVGYARQTFMGNWGIHAARVKDKPDRKITPRDVELMENILIDYYSQERIGIDIPYEALQHAIAGVSFMYFSQLTADADVRNEALKRAESEFALFEVLFSIKYRAIPRSIHIPSAERYVYTMLQTRKKNIFQGSSQRIH